MSLEIALDEPGVFRAEYSDVPFEGFVTARGDHLLRTAYLLTRDHQLAEDLLQTALAKAWGAWRRINGDPEAYVRKILVNTYASWWRRKWNGERPSEQLPEQAQHDGTDALGARFDLWEALGQLPKRQRATVVLRFYEDMSEADTADALGCSVGTVKSQTSKALARLRIDPQLLEAYASSRARPQEREPGGAAMEVDGDRGEGEPS